MNKKHNKTIIDLGTGDGRFVFKSAQANPNNLYIGIDPSEKQLQAYSKKINTNRLENAKLLVGSLKNLPEQIKGTADVLYVFLPWGTLLQNIVKPTNESSQRFASVLKKPATMEILLGYDPKSEPSESTRLELPELTKNYLLDEPIKIFELNGFKLVSLEQIDKKQLDNIETTWGKKLRFGKNRPLFMIKLEYA